MIDCDLWLSVGISSGWFADNVRAADPPVTSTTLDEHGEEAISNLNGDDGNDTFHANQGLWNGSEKYNGGSGSDRIVADSNNQNIGIASIYDVELIDANSFSNVSIQTSNSTSGINFLNLSGVTLSGIASIKGQLGQDYIYLETSNATYATGDLVYGGAGDDTIYSGLGNDTVNGDAGNDVLVGGLGKDILTGGGNADQFVFASVSDSLVGALVADKITDFSGVQGDKIDLSSIDANTSLANNQAFTFVGTSAFTGAGQVKAVLGSDGFTHIYGNVDANLAADFEIILTNAASLSSGSFVL